ncbi:DNA-3-methyladenine glycosylase 2 family protein [Octadecabacter sp.]|nr:DNA-3-methyladenine glycosylase 2 family protein [Octadecabacter sp.]
MTGRIIETDADVHEGMLALSAMCPRMKAAYALTGPLPLRRRADGFAQVLSAIVGQQVSVASAAAVWSRIEAAGFNTPAAVLAASDDELRAVGLSRQKFIYARELALADIDYIALRDMSDEAVIKTLVAVKGIGPWTAEVYAMFSLGRADVFAPGDLAMQEAARSLYDLPERPKEKAFREMADAWAPWRAVAARLLWAYYAYEKDRDGIR